MRPESLSLGPLSLEEYLRLEESATTRHEFVAGRVYAMSGTTVRHNLIVVNLLKGVDRLSHGTACRSYIIDIKLRAMPDRVYYPDMMVVCDVHDQDAVVLDSPCFIAEVASPSTRRTDRGEKLDAYLRIGSMRGYLVVEQDRRHVTLYVRSGDVGKREEIMTSGAVRIPCVDGELSLDDIYAGIEMPARVREDDDEWDGD
jgi:Uma2 family endonuclease